MFATLKSVIPIDNGMNFLYILRTLCFPAQLLGINPKCQGRSMGGFMVGQSVKVDILFRESLVRRG